MRLLIVLLLVLALPAHAEQTPVLVLQNGHTDVVISVALARGIAATASWDGTAKLWDVRSARVLATLDCGVGRLCCVSLSSDARWVAVAAYDGSAQLWDARTARRVAVPGGRASAVAFSPDGTLLACGGWDGTVSLWDVARLRVVRTFRGMDASRKSMSWSADGTLLAVGACDWTACVLDARSGRVARVIRWKGHQVADVDPPLEVAFGPDGRLAVSSAGLEEVRSYDVHTGRWTRAASHGAQALAVSRLALAMAVGSSEVVVRTGTTERRYPGSAGVALDGDWLAAGSFDTEAHVWSWRTGREVASLVGRSAGVTSVAADPRSLAAAARDGSVVLWDMAEGMVGLAFRWGSPLREGAPASAGSPMATGVALSADGTLLAASGPDTRVWEVRGGRPRTTFPGGAEGA